MYVLCMQCIECFHDCKQYLCSEQKQFNKEECKYYTARNIISGPLNPVITRAPEPTPKR